MRFRIRFEAWLLSTPAKLDTLGVVEGPSRDREKLALMPR
jgi:hypothetical protein